MVSENPAGHGRHCMEPVAWVGAAEFLEGLDERCEAASGTLTNWWVRGGWHYEFKE
jgi:hypothetical protein